MNILIAMNSRISHTGGGLERTTLNLLQFINSRVGYKAYGLFNDFETSLNSQFLIKGEINNPKDLRKIIIEKRIDIILFPAGPWYSKIGYEAIKGLNCKIITAYHSKEGYENYVYYNRIISQLRNSDKLKTKFTTCIRLILSPIKKIIDKYKYQKLMIDGYKKSDAFVLLSERFFKGFSEYYKLPDTHRLYAIGNSLSFDNENINLIEKKNKILIVSRLQEAQKKISLAIHAWQKIEDKYPDWSFDIVGEGIDKNYYKNLINKKSLKRIFLKGRQDPREFYNEASIFIMTSGIEGWGMTLTEAQQYGCVPIAIDTYESLHDILSDENSIIIPDNKNKIELLSNAIFKLIENEELRIKLLKRGLEDCKRFQSENIGNEWLKLFNSLYDINKN